MSIHQSLKKKGTVGVKKNVMKRYQRVNQLKAEGRWKEGDAVLGLPKTKILG
ncbi:MAG: hypothetical protein RL095_2693 [Verrucomicrobiota bacterium]|jgi:small basic protein (TIGR04137 family)